MIYSQGDPPEAAFFVESGSIKVSTVVRNGREAVLALNGAGDFFGVRCLLGTPHTATATALIDYRFKRKGFIEYGHDGRIRVHHSLRSAVVEDWF